MIITREQEDSLTPVRTTDGGWITLKRKKDTGSQKSVQVKKNNMTRGERDKLHKHEMRGSPTGGRRREERKWRQRRKMEWEGNRGKRLIQQKSTFLTTPEKCPKRFASTIIRLKTLLKMGYTLNHALTRKISKKIFSPSSPIGLWSWIQVLNSSGQLSQSVLKIFLADVTANFFDPKIFSNFSSRVSCELLFSFLKNLLVHDMLFMHTLPFILSPERVWSQKVLQTKQASSLNWQKGNLANEDRFGMKSWGRDADVSERKRRVWEKKKSQRTRVEIMEKDMKRGNSSHVWVKKK